MKKMPNTVDNIKQRILDLKGQVVDLNINRGRRKVASFRARIADVYASVFTVQNCTDNVDTISTYSYNDILCGEVKISNKRT